MKKNATLADNNIKTLAGDAEGETDVSGLPEKPKPYNGNPTVGKQIGQLTAREIEVLQFVATGKLNKQAAAELGISPKTVEKHRHHLSSKLGIRGIAGLTHFAIYTGIIPCNPQLAMA